ncbi:D-2-hydroxyacid dehydrogenase [Weizmannia acidilactici]|uniref:D-2-hydroxyacid dehydrogenase n=1 Tax=Weizmannia acidilactici TaxID=2607726 RepID=UPI00124D23FE|nr:D-2-hydroxyacid dehydrogenase [Weizmannia acidilactici]GER72476.1 glycerate dehydrogenase [Weizmannia acidilactici]
MKIVFTFQPGKTLLADLNTNFPGIDFLAFRGIETAQEALGDAEVIATYGEDLTEEIVMPLPRLKWVMVFSAGIEKMPLDALRKKGVFVTNARGIHKIPMAEYTFGCLLRHAKSFDLFRIRQEKHEWVPDAPLSEISGRCIMIVGMGAIGSEIARLAKAFGMKVIGVNTNGRKTENADEMYTPDTMVSALNEADYVVSVLPSTKTTRHFYTKTHFEAMKPSAVWINIGRGDAVEPQVLIDALQSGKIAHAYLDVFDEEPLPPEHPFWKIENITITPHISSHSEHYLPRAMEIFRHNLHTYLTKGRDYINTVDLEKGY